MKFLSYAAAVALFTASAAFAQTGPGAGANQPGLINAPPAAAGDTMSTGPSNPNPSAGTSMGSTSHRSAHHGTRHTSKVTHHHSTSGSQSTNRSGRTPVSARGNAQENTETQRLNQQQVGGSGTSSSIGGGMNSAGMSGAGMGAGMQSGSGMNAYGRSGMGSQNMGASGNGNPTGNPFDNGPPQQAQMGGPNCTPDNPSCGQQRRNPAINSSPQQRLLPNEGAATSPK